MNFRWRNTSTGRTSGDRDVNLYEDREFVSDIAMHFIKIVHKTEIYWIILRRKTMKTYMASPSTINREWYVVDATGHTLGRLASEVASILRGKNKPTFTPHIDTGDYVVIVNADKINVTGKKLDQKIYRSYSGYVGGMKEATLKEMLAKKPEEVIRLAVKGMLPKGPLGREMITKLHVYAGPEHKHQAQQPKALEIKY